MSKDIKKWSYETEIKYLDSEKEQLKEQVDNLKQDLQNRCDRCIELNDENTQLKQDLLRTEELQDEIILLEQDKESIYSIWKKSINRENNLIIDNKELLSENYKLQNSLIEQQMTKYDNKDYINKLKEENKSLIESKNIWFDSHRLVTQERDKLKQELKEYRGF